MGYTNGFIKTMKQFNEYNELVEGKFGSVYNIKDIKTLADAEDPEIVISGMGTMKLSTAKQRIVEIYKDLFRDALQSLKNKSDFAENQLSIVQGRLTSFVGAVADVEVEMRKPQYKRKLTMLKKKK